VRSVVVTVVLVVGLVAAYLLGSSQQGGATAQAAEAPTTKPVRTITMIGSGDATGVPDEMTFRLSVGSTADDVSTAMDQAGSERLDVEVSAVWELR
jgi:uncharacterized protein YggE